MADTNLTSDEVSMDPETLEALKGSIAKWERVVEGGIKENGGPTDCPLCVRFNSSYNKELEGEPCVGCPVMARTGQKHCGGSPYEAVEELETEYDSEEEGFESRYRAVAQRELDFLKSLLPRNAT